VYVDTESIADTSHFYRKLLETIISAPGISRSVKLKAGLEDKGNRFFQKIKSVTLFNAGLEFNHESSVRDYYDEFRNFLTGYATVGETELVLLIDEFPQTIENIRKKNTETAVNFLQMKRELRIDPVISKSIRFIYTGSIGLNQTVASINATATINDLASIEVEPLSETEALELFNRLLLSHKRIIRPDGLQALTEELQYYIPFHIQLIVQEIINATEMEDEVTKETISMAIKELLSLRHQNHFHHYYSRLKTYYKEEAFKYADNLLKDLAINHRMTKKDSLELAAKFNQESGYRGIIENLMGDGYIHYNTMQGVYLFNSPIVKRWWELYIC